ncbi:MAG TPA: type III-B CRISPR module-associated protein Cmr5 [Saprospiraceae bacterium]|nr:type III-B CRISPR module-associated protein Cmr5 [Saprospiraceae bacterium]
MSALKKLEQGRAKFAWDRAVLAKANNDLSYDEYKSYAKSLPMMIKTSGLGATLAFIRSKKTNKNGKNTAYGQIYDDLTAYFSQEHKSYMIYGDGTAKGELMEKIIDLDSYRYRMATVEVLAFMLWLRRFAEGLGKK